MTTSAFPAVPTRGYAHPDVLVTTEWLAEHLTDSKLRVIESNEDPMLYPTGHIPGAIQVVCARDLNDPRTRDYLGREAFETLMSSLGVANDTTIVFYGDKNNWWACYAFWVFQLFGHTGAKVLDGGRLKWEKEGRAMTREVPRIAPTTYRAPERNDTRIRAFRDEVLVHMRANRPLIDVRGPQEFSGERTNLPEYPYESVLRGGHIPGAKNVPWARAANPDDGTFRNADELRAIYETERGLRATDPMIVYCRIGERSSHTWFVLTYLLGYPDVRNYDGSWTEWGNAVRMPIEK